MDTPPYETQVERNRLHHLLSRTLNRSARWLPGRPRPAFRRRPTPPPRQLAMAEEWHFSGWRSSTYTLVAPRYEGRLPQPAYLFPHPAASGADWEKGAFAISPAFVLEIPYGRTVGRHGAVLTPDDMLLRDLSREFFCPIDDHPLLHEAELPKLTRLRGRYALLNGPGNSTYHWLFDALPRLEVLRLAGYRLEEFDGFLMTRPKYEPHYDTLSRLGIPEEKIIWCTRIRHFECDELVVPSFANDDLFTDSQQHPFVFPFLRGLLAKDEMPTARRRLYISRRDAVTARRGIVNEAEVAALLARFGFEEVALAELSFREQARAFASAEYIVSAHGGGLANLGFCQRPAQLLEFFAPDYVAAYYRTLACQMGLKYQYLFGEAVPSLPGTVNGGNIRIDLAQLEAVLQATLRPCVSSP